MIGTMGYLNQFRHSCHIDFFLAPGFRRCCGRLLRVSQLFCSTKITYVTESKILKVAIIGPPNAGKSTIINQIVGRRVLAMSKKVHTTQCCARAIFNEGPSQIIFLDTPGLVTVKELKKYKLAKSFFYGGEDAIMEADLIGVVHDVSNSFTREKLDRKTLRLLHLYKEKDSILFLNKVDTLKPKKKILDLCNKLTNGKLKSSSPIPDKLTEIDIKKIVEEQPPWEHFSHIFMVSALLGHGIDDARDYLLNAAKQGEWMFPPETFTDKKTEKIIEETVRSKLLEYLPKQIPYNLDIQLEYLDQREEGLTAVVLAESPKEKIKLLIVGHNGKRIKMICADAKEELEGVFKTKVNLKIVMTAKKVEEKAATS